MSKNIYDLIRRPIMTEKSTTLAESGKYVFEVDKAAEKNSVKKVIEKVFGVKVKAVNLLNQKGKQKRFKGVIGRRSAFKKAVVTLEKDHIIDLAGGIK